MAFFVSWIICIYLFEKKKSLTTSEYVENVVSAKGEVSALSHAELLISHCERLNDKELINFFEILRKNFEVNSDDLYLASQNYKSENTSENLVRLMKLSEPLRRDIFTRCNGITRGTIRLVNLRKRLLELIIKKPELKACLLYTSPSPRDPKTSRMPSSA